jgi:hypothetical protein
MCIRTWRIRANTRRDRKCGKDTTVSRVVDGGHGEVGSGQGSIRKASA